MTSPMYSLDRAHQQWPRARRCALVDDRCRPVCNWPVDPANGDHAFHPWCAPEQQRPLAAVRLDDAQRRSAAARAAAQRGAA